MLRTPDSCFEGLPEWPYLPSYVEGLPALQGARLAYVDMAGDLEKLGAGQAALIGAGGAAYRRPKLPKVALCLHGNPSWGYLYRKMAPVFAAAGLRVIIPDLVGFGRSDKPESEATHSFEFHRNYLLALLEHWDLQDIMLVVQDWGGILGLTLPVDMPERFSHLLVMNTAITLGAGMSEGFMAWRAYSNKSPNLEIGKMLARGRPEMDKGESAAYDAPYPDASFKAGPRAFPNLVPVQVSDPGAEISRWAAHFWQNQWVGQSFMAVGTEDPVLGLAAMNVLRKCIRNCPEPMLVKGGHFVPEWGAPIAHAGLKHFGI